MAKTTKPTFVFDDGALIAHGQKTHKGGIVKRVRFQALLDPGLARKIGAPFLYMKGNAPGPATWTIQSGFKSGVPLELEIGNADVIMVPNGFPARELRLRVSWIHDLQVVKLKKEKVLRLQFDVDYSGAGYEIMSYFEHVGAAPGMLTLIATDLQQVGIQTSKKPKVKKVKVKGRKGGGKGEADEPAGVTEQTTVFSQGVGKTLALVEIAKRPDGHWCFGYAYAVASDTKSEPIAVDGEASYSLPPQAAEAGLRTVRQHLAALDISDELLSGDRDTLVERLDHKLALIMSDQAEAGVATAESEAKPRRRKAAKKKAAKKGPTLVN